MARRTAFPSRPAQGRLGKAVRPRDGLGKPSYEKRSLDLALARVGLLHRLHLRLPVQGQSAPRVGLVGVGDEAVADAVGPYLPDGASHLLGGADLAEHRGEAVRRVAVRPRWAVVGAEVLRRLD